MFGFHLRFGNQVYPAAQVMAVEVLLRYYMPTVELTFTANKTIFNCVP